MHLKYYVFAAAGCLLAAPAAAQTGGVCQPVFDGMKKAIVTTNHMYLSMTGGSTSAMESITAGGVLYIQVNGKWMGSPTSLSDMQQLTQGDALTKTTSCQKLPDEAVGGTTAIVFHVQHKTDSSSSDGKVWLAKSSGLPLRAEDDVVSSGTKTHISTRYEYTNVQAPPGIK
jgi:hypothetical protein